MPFKKTINKEELEKLEIKSYEGKIILVNEDRKIAEAVQMLKKYSVLGFDTETRPAFKKGKYYPVSLLQLASPEEVYLFQLQKLKNFTPLQKLLNSKNILKVGAAIRDDIHKLNHFFPVSNKRFTELQQLVKIFEIKDISLKKMTAIVLGFRISKGQQISNWEADPLQEAQILYAATDAWVSLLIYEKLIKSIPAKS